MKSSSQGSDNISKRINQQEVMRQLYCKLLAISEIPIIESPDIHSKEIFLKSGDKKEIYIKKCLPIRDKLKVLLHEYSHYTHLTHYYSGESRAESEIIASGSAFFICRVYGLSIYKDIDLAKLSNDKLSATIQVVAEHILASLEQA